MSLERSLGDIIGGQLTQGTAQKLVMAALDPEDEDFDSFFADAPYLQTSCHDSSSCPPPMFTLPAPPRPPWLEQGCSSQSPHESCDNILIIDSQVQLQETFQNLTIIAVCAAILVIMLVVTTAVIWRWRKSGDGGCQCAGDKRDCCSTLEVPGDILEMKSTNEVYDNPNYSHILIGGRPFFILPSGELSDHVPVPHQGELLTAHPALAGDLLHPDAHAQNHVYEPGSSTYRSGSDYDTESSTYRPDSEGAPGAFPPIYEEIDKCSNVGEGVEESVFQGDQPKTNDVIQGKRQDNFPQRFLQRGETSSPGGKSDGSAWTASPSHLGRGDGSTWSSPSHAGRGEGWSWQNDTGTASPGRGQRLNSRYRPPTRPETSSVYYYSDTLKRKTMPGMECGGRDSVQESDSGVSSRSGHNTSSESTPQPAVLGVRGAGQPVRTVLNHALSSDEDVGHEPGVGGQNRTRNGQEPLRPRTGLDIVRTSRTGQEPVRTGRDARTGKLFKIDTRIKQGRQDPVDTQVIVRNVTNKREPTVNL